jgi:hypothetical protein
LKNAICSSQEHQYESRNLVAVNVRAGAGVDGTLPLVLEGLRTHLRCEDADLRHGCGFGVFVHLPVGRDDSA